LPTESKYGPEEMLALIAHDKKNLNNTINLIFIKKIGEGIIVPIGTAKLTDLMRRSAEWMNS
jgi:3-dehydroquinate synthetase